MTSVMKARTARIWHTCSSCRGVAIAPGHRYLLHTTLPQLVVVKECLACAQDRDDFSAVTADACGTYCHGLLPCALPHRHAGDSSCRSCIDPPASPREGAETV